MPKGGIGHNNAGVDKDENGQNDGNPELSKSGIGVTPDTVPLVTKMFAYLERKAGVKGRKPLKMRHLSRIYDRQ